MRLINRVIIALLLLVAGVLGAQTLKMDLNGYPMPMARAFQADSLYIVNTAYQTVAVPAGCSEVTVWATATCAINEINTMASVCVLPANVPVRIGIADVANIYVRRIATATAATIYFLWGVY